MKVAIAFHGCYRRGGVERVMLESANYLASRGHETHAFAFEWDPDPHAVESYVVRHTLPAASRAYLPRLRAFLHESKRAIGALSPAADVCAGFGIESPDHSVIWMQSVHKAWLEISRRERNFRGRIKQKLNPAHLVILALEKRRFATRNYRKTVALTPAVKADIMRLYGVPEADIVVIPNGYSPGEFSLLKRQEHRDPARSRLGLKADDFAVVFVANELERKGFYPLVKAIASLRDPSIHLLAVGRLNAAAYRREIEALGMTQRIHWTGPADCVAEYYAAGDLFALPTQYEAWGLVIVEAMACGLPVVTSRLAGAAAAVKENETGILLNTPHNPDEIAQAIAAIRDRSDINAEAIAAATAPYAWSKVLKRYEDVLRDACA